METVLCNLSSFCNTSIFYLEYADRDQGVFQKAGFVNTLEFVNLEMRETLIFQFQKER